MEILCMKGTWHCHIAHTFWYTSLAGKWSLSYSLLLLVEIYWKIFFIAQYLKILPPIHLTYLLKKYRTARFFAPAVIQTLKSEEHLKYSSQRNLYPKFWIWLEQLKKWIVILRWNKAGFSNHATSMIPNLVKIQDQSLSYRLYFKESQWWMLRYMNRVECWWRHRVKDPKKFLVPFSFNKPVVEQPKGFSCDHPRMFWRNSCRRTWLAAGILWLTELHQQLQHRLLGETKAGVCSGGTSCQMGALWWRLL